MGDKQINKWQYFGHLELKIDENDNIKAIENNNTNDQCNPDKKKNEEKEQDIKMATSYSFYGKNCFQRTATTSKNLMSINKSKVKRKEWNTSRKQTYYTSPNTKKNVKLKRMSIKSNNDLVYKAKISKVLIF